jgi:hypothetical protein
MLTMEIVWEVGDAPLNLAETNAELTNPPPSSSHYQWNINEQEIEDFRSVDRFFFSNKLRYMFILLD